MTTRTTRALVLAFTSATLIGGAVPAAAHAATPRTATITNYQVPKFTDVAGASQDTITLRHVKGVTWTVNGSPVVMRTSTMTVRAPEGATRVSVVALPYNADWTVIHKTNPTLTWTRTMDRSPATVTIPRDAVRFVDGRASSDSVTLKAIPGVRWENATTGTYLSAGRHSLSKETLFKVVAKPVAGDITLAGTTAFEGTFTKRLEVVTLGDRVPARASATAVTLPMVNGVSWRVSYGKKTKLVSYSPRHTAATLPVSANTTVTVRASVRSGYRLGDTTGVWTLQP